MMTTAVEPTELRDGITGEPIVEPSDTPAAETYAGRVFAEQNKPADPEPEDLRGPFDSLLAWNRIAALSTQVNEARIDFERAKESAKRAREKYDEANTEMNDLIADLKAWERGDDQQPHLRVLPDADAETIDARRARLHTALLGKHVYLTVEELATLDRVSLDALDAWIPMRSGTVPPAVLATCHHANGEGVCTKCGDPLPTDEGVMPHPEGAFVGFGCQGVDVDSKPKRGKRK